MTEGIIIKALSGFYYVKTEDSLVTCKARGRFRLDGTSPLVGDRVLVTSEENKSGRIEKVLDRKNFFIRPAVANLDTLVFVAANVNPVTDPFLIDRVAVIAHEAGCELVICVNKIDLDAGENLVRIFTEAGYRVVRTSAETGEGAQELLAVLRGKVCAFTGNSGVGKSSILNVLLPEAAIPTDAVSEHLGRGKHTTRHVELYPVGEDLGQCRFADCAHIKEPGCAVRQALELGKIGKSRYSSYVRLYDLTAKQKPWEQKVN